MGHNYSIAVKRTSTVNKFCFITSLPNWRFFQLANIWGNQFHFNPGWKVRLIKPQDFLLWRNYWNCKYFILNVSYSYLLHNSGSNSILLKMPLRQVRRSDLPHPQTFHNPSCPQLLVFLMPPKIWSKTIYKTDEC